MYKVAPRQTDNDAKNAFHLIQTNAWNKAKRIKNVADTYSIQLVYPNPRVIKIYGAPFLEVLKFNSL